MGSAFRLNGIDCYDVSTALSQTGLSTSSWQGKANSFCHVRGPEFDYGYLLVPFEAVNRYFNGTDSVVEIYPKDAYSTDASGQRVLDSSKIVSFPRCRVLSARKIDRSVSPQRGIYLAKIVDERYFLGKELVGRRYNRPIGYSSGTKQFTFDKNTLVQTISGQDSTISYHLYDWHELFADVFSLPSNPSLDFSLFQNPPYIPHDLDFRYVTRYEALKQLLLFTGHYLVSKGGGSSYALVPRLQGDKDAFETSNLYSGSGATFYQPFEIRSDASTNHPAQYKLHFRKLNQGQNDVSQYSVVEQASRSFPGNRTTCSVFLPYYSANSSSDKNDETGVSLPSMFPPQETLQEIVNETAFGVPDPINNPDKILPSNYLDLAVVSVFSQGLFDDLYDQFPPLEIHVAGFVAVNDAAIAAQTVWYDYGDEAGPRTCVSSETKPPMLPMPPYVDKFGDGGTSVLVEEVVLAEDKNLDDKEVYGYLTDPSSGDIVKFPKVLAPGETEDDCVNLRVPGKPDDSKRVILLDRRRSFQGYAEYNDLLYGFQKAYKGHAVKARDVSSPGQPYPVYELIWMEHQAKFVEGIVATNWDGNCDTPILVRPGFMHYDGRPPKTKTIEFPVEKIIESPGGGPPEVTTELVTGNVVEAMDRQHKFKKKQIKEKTKVKLVWDSFIGEYSVWSISEDDPKEEVVYALVVKNLPAAFVGTFASEGEVPEALTLPVAPVEEAAILLEWTDDYSKLTFQMEDVENPSPGEPATKKKKVSAMCLSLTDFEASFTEPVICWGRLDYSDDRPKSDGGKGPVFIPADKDFRTTPGFIKGSEEKDGQIPYHKGGERKFRQDADVCPEDQQTSTP